VLTVVLPPPPDLEEVPLADVVLPVPAAPPPPPPAADVVVDASDDEAELVEDPEVDSDAELLVVEAGMEELEEGDALALDEGAAEEEEEVARSAQSKEPADTACGMRFWGQAVRTQGIAAVWMADWEAGEQWQA